MTSPGVGYGALLAAWPSPIIQDSPNRFGILSHVENGNSRRYSGLNSEVDSEVASTYNRSSKETMLLRKHLGVPRNPRYRLPESLVKLVTAANLPRVVILIGIAEVIFDELKKLDRLALHFRASRRSSSAREIRLTAPARYAFHRESRSAR